MSLNFYIACFLFVTIGLRSTVTTNCNCKTGCGRDPFTRCRSCKDGWYGPYCQKRNVALGGTATQQGAYHDSIRYYTAELAVDGNTNTDFRNGSCSHTDDKNNSWWSVRLGENGVNQIKYMTIHNRKNKPNAHRRNGMKILVDGVRCKKWPDDVTPHLVDHVTCDTTMTGSNLTIRVPGNSFSLCEVQVFVCSDFWFGEDCDKQCNCLHSDDVCDKVSGSCRRGCQLGFTGGDCQTECDDGHYGLNCASQCGHCLNNSGCNKNDGRCPGGCAAGWKNETCDEVCDDRQYGLNCTSLCGHCLNNAVCDKTDGRCPGGCAAGWMTDRCDEGCDDGQYGLNCTSLCGHCLNKAVCDKTDGRCPGGCAAGWKENVKCDNECDDEQYGLNCTSQCGHCLNNAVCNKTDGRCPGGCEAGWEKEKCDEVCKDGQYGLNCTSQCGHCLNNTVCNKTDGRCPGDCAAGWMTDRCDEECENGTYGFNCSSRCGRCLDNATCEKTHGHCLVGCSPGWMGDRCDTVLVAGALKTSLIAGGVFVLLAVVVLFTLYLKRRRKQPATDDAFKFPPGTANTDVDSFVDSAEDEVEEEEVYAVETYVDDTYENATTCTNFTPSYVSLSKLQEYIQQMTAKKGFHIEYKFLPYGINGVVDIGKIPDNRKKNRFAGLYPYDHSRVILDGVDDYINASYIPGWNGKPKYIATQGPKPESINDLWRMLWQKGVNKVVMVTNLMEMNKKKCERYWPVENGQKDYGEINVKNAASDTRANFKISKLILKNRKTGEERQLTHFHFTAWPDHDVPSAPALVTFWKKVNQEEFDLSRPLVVHCSAGVGRTGTYIALDYLIVEADAKNKVCVYDCVSKQRESRMNMVQTVSQYEFVHHAVLEAVKSLHTLYTCGEFERTFGLGRGYSGKKDDILKKEFKALQVLRPQLSDKDVSDALLPENKDKNKDKNILPGNKSRPFLSTIVRGSTNYINAVYLPSYQSRANLIVTQTPVRATQIDFWSLVYDHDCFTIVCLDEETDVFPREGIPIQRGPFYIDQSGIRDEGCFTERKFRLKNTEKKESPATVTLFTFNNKKLSQEVVPFLELVTAVERIVSRTDEQDDKVIVHCHDGASQSGVFCSALNIVSRLRLDNEADIFLTIRELQLIRPWFIQTLTQYKFCYDLVREHIRSSNVYANT